MQLNEQPEKHLAIGTASFASLRIGAKDVPIRYVRNKRARRYIIRVANGSGIRATIPPFGSKAEAYAFAEREHLWIQRQLNKPPRTEPRPQSLMEGGAFLFRGERRTVQVEPNTGIVYFADQKISLSEDQPADLWPVIKRHLFHLVIAELPPRTIELAGLHGVTVRRVVIRSQRTRWGSCSAKRTVSLNWQLIQMPSFVSDYIILHELMHLRQMNHSTAFWRCVEEVCPGYRVAEQWIKKHADELRQWRGNGIGIGK